MQLLSFNTTNRSQEYPNLFHAIMITSGQAPTQAAWLTRPMVLSVITEILQIENGCDGVNVPSFLKSQSQERDKKHVEGKTIEPESLWSSTNKGLFWVSQVIIFNQLYHVHYTCMYMHFWR